MIVHLKPITLDEFNNNYKIIRTVSTQQEQRLSSLDANTLQLINNSDEKTQIRYTVYDRKNGKQITKSMGIDDVKCIKSIVDMFNIRD